MRPMNPTEIDTLTPIVARVLKIDDITAGDPQKNYLVRYRGQLYGDSDEAYDHLATSLRPLDITPLFRNEEGRHAVWLMPGAIQAKPSNPLVNLILFILTVLSVIFAGALYAYDGPAPESLTGMLSAILHSLSSGIPFAVSMLAI